MSDLELVEVTTHAQYDGEMKQVVLFSTVGITDDVVSRSVAMVIVQRNKKHFIFQNLLLSVTS